jgi:hypothetical protein
MAQRFNHVELTYAKGALGGRLRDQISSFYEEVFGWEAAELEILGHTALLLRVDPDVTQFILLAEGRNPIDAPGYDHLGIQLETRNEVDTILERCIKRQERDEGVRIKIYEDLPQDDVTVHAFYIKYLLPIWLDVQCLEWKPGAEPKHRWIFGEA